MFVKIVVEKYGGKGVSDKHGRTTEPVVPYETHMYQTEEVSWEKVPGDLKLALDDDWTGATYPFMPEPTCPEDDTEYLAVKLHDRKLLIIAWGATLFVMNDNGKTVDVVRGAPL